VKQPAFHSGVARSVAADDDVNGASRARNCRRRDRRSAGALVASLVTAVAALVTFSTDAAPVAVAHPSLWPASLSSVVAFDRASRADLIVYATALDDAERMNSEELRAALAVSTFDADSVKHWLAGERQRVVLNYGRASHQCAHSDWTCVAGATSFDALAKAGRSLPGTAPKEFLAWHEDLVAFAKAFALEQLKLAALFPSANNETDVFSDLEWAGDSLPDRTFALTFDDGPTAAGGTTDQTLAMLATLNKSGAFFLLGVKLEKRVEDDGSTALAALYGHQCVASHGWEHKSHATWDDWQGSVLRSKELLNATFPPTSVLPLFRPPNGQRRPDSGAFFASQSLHVALWNIDAYDWNSSMDGEAVAGRVITLIMLRRHGVALFHDMYGKALVALPAVFSRLGPVINWLDCHELARL
jgi:peptidoglycan-N-acetylglucosamine deacetylase